MVYKTTHVDCSDCGQPFPLSVAQQALYAELGFDQPRRCPTCRQSLDNLRRRIANPRALLVSPN
jgi:Probable zinc-ribbon domain